MHKGTPASDSMRSIAVTVSATSILLSVHGLLTDSELFFVLLGGVDLFVVVYAIGIIISLVILIALWKRNPQAEYVGMVASTWFYTLLCLFLSVVTYLHSPLIVICFGIAMINAILAAYIKKGKINGEENIGGSATAASKLQSGIPGSNTSLRLS